MPSQKIPLSSSRVPPSSLNPSLVSFSPRFLVPRLLPVISSRHSSPFFVYSLSPPIITLSLSLPYFIIGLPTNTTSERTHTHTHIQGGNNGKGLGVNNDTLGKVYIVRNIVEGLGHRWGKARWGKPNRNLKQDTFSSPPSSWPPIPFQNDQTH